MCNGRGIGNDFFIKMKRARGKLEENLQKIGVNVPVESKLILINEEGTVNIMDADQQNNYIKCSTLKEYVHNGAKLYMANEFDLKDGQYLASDWITR